MSILSPFRCFLLELSGQLTTKNVEDIRFVCNLPENLDTALKIFCKLEELTVLEPGELENVFEKIHRIDLAKKVKEYAKSQKKKKKTASKNDDSHISDRANIEVALTHNRLLHDHVEDIQTKNKLQREQRETILEVGRKLGEVQMLLQSVKDSIAGQQQQLTDSSSESDSPISPPNTMNRKLNEELHRQLTATGSSKKIMHFRRSAPQSHESSSPPKNPLYPPTIRPPQFSQEESNTSTPSESNPTLQPALADRQVALSTTSGPRKSNANGDSILVTGNISKPCGVTKQKPIPPPKPKKIQTTQCKTILEFETEPDKVETEEREKENRKEKDDRDESGYGGTGDDQEFNDPLQFLKISPGSSLPPPSSDIDDLYKTSPGYYKSIQREKVEEASYYKVTSRQKIQEEMNDEAIYETVTQHLTTLSNGSKLQLKKEQR